MSDDPGLHETQPGFPVAVLWIGGSSARCTNVMQLTLEEAQELESRTRRQSSSPLWHHERQGRLTASKFGDIIGREAPVTAKFVQHVLGGSSIQATKYMVAGSKNEKAATQRYAARTGNTVYDAGLCVNPGVPFLGASPDGVARDSITGDFGLIEVKTLARAMDLGIENIAESADRSNKCTLPEG